MLKVTTGATITYRQEGSYVYLDRIEVKPEDRQKGIMAATFKEIAKQADQKGLIVMFCICADNHDHDEVLLRVSERYGWESLAMDGEVYPMDRIREPQQKERKYNE